MPAVRNPPRPSSRPTIFSARFKAVPMRRFSRPFPPRRPNPLRPSFRPGCKAAERTTSAKSVCGTAARRIERFSARRPLTDLPCAVYIPRSRHAGRRRPSALRRLDCISFGLAARVRPRILSARILSFSFRPLGGLARFFGAFKRSARRLARIHQQPPARTYIRAQQSASGGRICPLQPVKHAFERLRLIRINDRHFRRSLFVRQAHAHLFVPRHDVAARLPVPPFQHIALFHRRTPPGHKLCAFAACLARRLGV